MENFKTILKIISQVFWIIIFILGVAGVLLFFSPIFLFIFAAISTPV